MLIYPKVYLHVVEASWDIIISLINHLNSQRSAADTFEAECRVVFCSSDIPRRAFPLYSFRVLNLSITKVGEYKPSDSLDVVVVDSLKSVLRLGALLSAVSKAEYISTLDNLHDMANDVLLPQSTSAAI